MSANDLINGDLTDNKSVIPETQLPPTSPITVDNPDVDAMLQEVTGTMQPPSPELMQEKVVAELPEDIYADASGEIWNEEKHATGADGKPVYTQQGYFRKRRGTGKPRTKTELESATSRKVAEYSAMAFTQTGVVIFGEEWQPIVNDKEDEREMLVQAFDDYFTIKGVVDIPAGLALAIALGGYSARRMNKPQTKGKLKQFKTWVVTKFQNLWLRRRKKKQPVSPQVK